MSEGVEARPLSKSVSVKEDRAARRLVVLSGVALAAQVAATDYGPGNTAAAALWFLFGCVLLWLVYRKHSRAARGVVIVFSLVGAVVYGLSALGDGRFAFLALAFLGQAAPLLSRQVRRHVHTAA